MTTTPAIPPPEPATRRVLANRRGCETVTFDHASSPAMPAFRYRATCSRFADGGIAEIFLNAEKSGTAVDLAARDAAITASLALQFGCPLDTLRHALGQNAQGEPASALGTALALLAVVP